MQKNKTQKSVLFLLHGNTEEQSCEHDGCNCCDCGCGCTEEDSEILELNNQITVLKEAMLRNQAELQNYKRRKQFIWYSQNKSYSRLI